MLGGGRRRMDRLGGTGPGPVDAGKRFFLSIVVYRRARRNPTQPHHSPSYAAPCPQVSLARSPHARSAVTACAAPSIAVDRQRRTLPHWVLGRPKSAGADRRRSVAYFPSATAVVSAGVARLKGSFFRLVQFLWTLLRNYIY